MNNEKIITTQTLICDRIETELKILGYSRPIISKKLKQGDPEYLLELYLFAMMDFSSYFYNFVKFIGFEIGKASILSSKQIIYVIEDLLVTYFNHKTYHSIDEFLKFPCNSILVILKIAQLFMFLKKAKRHHNALYVASIIRRNRCLEIVPDLGDVLIDYGIPSALLTPEGTETPSIEDAMKLLKSFQKQNDIQKSLLQYEDEMNVREFLEENELMRSFTEYHSQHDAERVKEETISIIPKEVRNEMERRKNFDGKDPIVDSPLDMEMWLNFER
eukprot:TRINITY_DN2258_c0_g2_i1.p1 TRINITY_DN2258_c0_g2~~TRINITY_DN2258_c0_g2_i1.p1  ORF type:complete len:274 (+),score=80.63 TRINITY_DN2258_c0_g2_i1:75-896(+)